MSSLQDISVVTQQQQQQHEHEHGHEHGHDTWLVLLRLCSLAWEGVQGLGEPGKYN